MTSELQTHLMQALPYPLNRAVRNLSSISRTKESARIAENAKGVISWKLVKAHRHSCLEADLSERRQGRVQDVDHDSHELPKVGDDDPGVAAHRADEGHESGQVGG